MIGRAGRPQFDTEGVAVIMTQKDVSAGSVRKTTTNLWCPASALRVLGSVSGRGCACCCMVRRGRNGER